MAELQIMAYLLLEPVYSMVYMDEVGTYGSS